MKRKENFLFNSEISFDKLKFSEDDLKSENLEATISRLVDQGQHIEVAIFRSGKFKHPKYGMISFDNNFFSKIIANFEMKINSTDPSANRDHEPEHGSYGWVNPLPGNLYTREMIVNSGGNNILRTVLFANFQPNQEGWRALLTKKFRYISSEIHPNYTDHEILEGQNEPKKYGPVLLGFALTNQPFISGLPSMFSNNGLYEEKITEVIDYEQEDTTQTTVNETNAREGENEMKFSQFMKALNALTSVDERQKYFSENHSTVEGEEMADTLEQIKLSIESERASIIALQRATAEANEYKSRVERATAEKADLLNQLAQSREVAYSDSVALFSKELESMGLHTSVINETVSVLKGLDVTHRDLKFSLKVGDERKEVNFQAVLKQIFSAMPKDALLDTGSTLESGDPPVEVAPVTESNTEPVTPVVAEDGVPAKIKLFNEKHPFIKIQDYDMIDENGNFKV